MEDFENVTISREDLTLLKACLKAKGKYIPGSPNRDLEKASIFSAEWASDDFGGHRTGNVKAGNKAREYLRWRKKRKLKKVGVEIKWIIPTLISIAELVYIILE